MTAATTQKKKPQAKQKARVSADIISKNPTRRSRAERALVQLTTTSYPHYLIGNIAHLATAGDESVAKKVLDFENKLGMLEFVRTLFMTGTETGLTVDVGVIKIDQNNSRIDKQLDGAIDITSFDFTAPEAGTRLGGNSNLAKALVEIYHRNQTRGMTRRHDITAANWKLVEKKLTLGNSNGLGGLGRSETVFDVTADDVTKLLTELFASGKFAIQFTDSAIRITSEDEVTKEITYVIPEKA